jgi:hypothetical protein
MDTSGQGKTACEQQAARDLARQFHHHLCASWQGDISILPGRLYFTAIKRTAENYKNTPAEKIVNSRAFFLPSTNRPNQVESWRIFLYNMAYVIFQGGQYVCS